MDAKPAKQLLLIGLILSTLLACEKKPEQVPVIVDDTNSQYAGKTCYGRSKPNQFVLTWSDGSASLFHGSKEQLQAKLEREISSERTVVLAEQDREFSLKNLKFQAISEPAPSSAGIYWQVWGQEDAQTHLLWERNIKGQGVTIAVIDAGIDIDHPALENRIAVNENEIPSNGIDDDQNGIVDDYKGFDFASKRPRALPSAHGTHVAGIIAAEPKGNPMLGVAPQAKILPLNIMGDQGGGSLSAAIYAIKYAQGRGARIINASWGGAVCADLLKQVIAEVGDHGVLFVAAAGNDGSDLDVFPEYPAAFSLGNQITVGATVQSGLMATFSNYSRKYVHILAPGHQILSTVPNGWQLASGTSMATPFISGISALLWSAHPEATLAQVRTAIVNSVITPQDYHPVVARGRINAPQALVKLEAYLQQSQTQ